MEGQPHLPLLPRGNKGSLERRVQDMSAGLLVIQGLLFSVWGKVLGLRERIYMVGLEVLGECERFEAISVQKETADYGLLGSTEGPAEVKIRCYGWH